MDNCYNCLDDIFTKYIGQTVTIFTNSGGYSGSGFTGVLMSVNNCVVRLLISVGQRPSYPMGYNRSISTSYYTNFRKHNGNILGAIAVIPTNSIVAFTHNAI